MRAIVVNPSTATGFDWGEVPEPVAGPDELVVDVRAVSVNRGDLVHATVSPPGTIRGYDFAGVVREAAASGIGPKAGSAVAGVLGEGSWAETVVAPIRRVAPLPPGLEPTTAAALPVVGLTALYGLQRAGRLLGRNLVVTGAAGGVGGVVVQLAALGGATVTALVGSPERTAGLVELGATVTGTYDDPPAGRADIVIDTAGGDAFTAAMSLLGPGGVGVSVGNAARAAFVLPAEFGQARAAFSHTWISVLYEMDCQADPTADLAYLLELAAAGRLDPRAGTVVSWEEADAVLAGMKNREIAGKAVLTLS
jgi:NADPH:quinone reductase